MVSINIEKCAGCGWGAPFCPTDAIKGWWPFQIDSEKCIECFSEAYHFDEHVSISDKESPLDRTKGSRRPFCAENCPCDAIIVK